jgi:predicted ATPase
MQGLTELEVAELLRRRFGDTEFCDAILPLIYRESEGNPLLVDEILSVLKKGRSIFYNGLEWRFAMREGDLPFPPTTMDNFYPRFQTLEEEDLKLLKCAAVIGMEFDCDLLAQCLGSHRLHWDQCLERIATATRLVRRLGKVWRFGHFQFGKAAYRLLSDEERREYHLGIADYYRREKPEILEQNIETVVRHLCAAGYTRDAVELLEKLADRARLEHEESLAADYYHLALRQLDRLPENRRIREVRADLLLELGQTQIDQGSAVIACETLKEALNRSKELGDKLRANSAQNLLWEAEELEGESGDSGRRLTNGHEEE